MSFERDEAPILLRPSVKKWLGMVAGSLCFVAIGIWLIPSNGLMIWLASILFGLCAAIGLVSMLPNASFLRLDEQGFTVRSLYRERRYEWVNVSDFAVASVGSNPMVVFNLKPSQHTSRILSDLNQAISSRDAGLPENYGMTHQELADLMNLHQRQQTSSAAVTQQAW